MLKNSDGKSNRQLAEKYCVGRTQVQNIMKRKRKILDLYEDDANSSDINLYMCIQTTCKHTNINQIIFV